MLKVARHIAINREIRVRLLEALADGQWWTLRQLAIAIRPVVPPEWAARKCESSDRAKKRSHPILQEKLLQGMKLIVASRLLALENTVDLERRHGQRRLRKYIPTNDYYLACKAGHLYTPETTYYRFEKKSQTVSRQCKPCQKEREKQRRAKQRQATA